MANIHDTLHPVTSPSDNLYPNINPVVNIPDESIPKRKMAFPIDSNGVTALIPTDAYVDIADLGIPGQVRFPSGTRYVYVHGGDVIVTPDLGEDKIYGIGVTSEWKFEIIVYSKNSDSYIAKRFNVGDNPVGSVEDDDFVVLILMLSPVESGPQVIPIYSIIPFEFIKYNTQPYEKLLAQTMCIATIDGSYADLGAGKDGDGNQISTTYAKKTENYPDLGAGKDGDGNQISTTYAKQTGSYPSLMAGGVQAELLANNSSLNSCIPDEIGMWKMWYVSTDGNAQTITDKPTEVTTAFKVEAIKIHEGTGGARVIQRLNDMRSNEFARYGTENGSGVTNFQAWKEIVTSDGSYPNLGAGKDGDGNVIASTYAKVDELSNETQLRTAADQAIMALIDDIEDGTTIVAKSESANTATTAETANTATKASQDGEGNVIAKTYAKKTDIPALTKQYQHNVTIKNGEDAIITTTVLTSTSDSFSSVDELITFLGNAGFSVSAGPKLLPACGTVVAMAGNASVVYPVVGVGKYGNRVDGIGFYYFRSDVSVGRAGYQVLMNSSITYFNDTITQI